VPPFATTTFRLGCTVVAGEDRLLLDVEVETDPDARWQSSNAAVI
jgi:hypothetical protein